MGGLERYNVTLLRGGDKAIEVIGMMRPPVANLL